MLVGFQKKDGNEQLGAWHKNIHTNNTTINNNIDNICMYNYSRQLRFSYHRLDQLLFCRISFNVFSNIRKS